jgi:hypothetical protein
MNAKEMGISLLVPKQVPGEKLEEEAQERNITIVRMKALRSGSRLI